MADSGSPPPGPWNPGIESTLPEPFLSLSTVFSTANVSSDIGATRQLSIFSGIPMERLSAFRPARLVLHEVLVRVMAELSVPDGEKYEDLGINFRRMTATILDTYIAPLMPEVEAAYSAMLKTAADVIDRALADAEAAKRPAAVDQARRSWLPLRRTPVVPAPVAPETRDLQTAAEWRRRAEAADDAFEKGCYEALASVSSAIIGRHGRLVGSRSLVVDLAIRRLGSTYGSTMIGRLIDPHFREAVLAEGFRFLPIQPQPVVMNVKGASASGKSTMRPLQKRLAARLGLEWTNFALISPDIWRKFLLDYAVLGAATRYAGTLTGHEIEIIDRKLDRFMSDKAGDGRMSHLLIDRFRFDSFSSDTNREDGSQLLTRFGDRVFMFFMITPPEETVERAYKRGEQFGRYKAVDDLLAHNVEAYSGIPGLFFTWALRADKRVHFEFLDNSVAEGVRPRTVAFGENGAMTVLDVGCMLDVERYQRINIEARSRPEIYAMPPEHDVPDATGFLRQCVKRMPIIDFAAHATGRIYARTEAGRLAWWNNEAFEDAVHDPVARAALCRVLQPPALTRSSTPSFSLEARDPLTLGQWGATQ